MDWKTILALVMSVIANLKDLFPLPTIEDSAGVRTWLTALVSVLKRLAAATPVVIDDEAAIVLDRIVANDDTYAAFHVLLVNIFTKAGAPGVIMACPCDEDSCPHDVKAFAQKAGFNPLLILGIIQAVLKVIEIIKNLKDKDPVAA